MSELISSRGDHDRFWFFWYYNFIFSRLKPVAFILSRSKQCFFICLKMQNGHLPRKQIPHLYFECPTLRRLLAAFFENLVHFNGIIISSLFLPFIRFFKSLPSGAASQVFWNTYTTVRSLHILWEQFEKCFDSESSQNHSYINIRQFRFLSNLSNAPIKRNNEELGLRNDKPSI